MKRTIALLVALALWGCKKEEPKPSPAPPPVRAVPAPPPPAPPRAAAECAAPVEKKAPVELKVANLDAVLEGTTLTFKTPDADGVLKLGVLGPLNEDSGANLFVLKKYVKFFSDEKVDAVVVTGDVGEVADGIARVLKPLAALKVPVLAIAGNRECRGEFSEGLQRAKQENLPVVNMNQVRAVTFPEATLVSLPGYHDPNYINCATGCRYFGSTVDEVIGLAKENASRPVVLVAHGPFRGEGANALDYASSGGNVGDPEVKRALEEGGIRFGVFSNIKEAGGRATDLQNAQVRQATFVDSLYVNPGPADTVGWEMNDGSKSSGLAAVMAIQGQKAAWKLYRAKPLTPAEKKQAKALDPPPRPDPEETAMPDAVNSNLNAPHPPPGKPARAP